MNYAEPQQDVMNELPESDIEEEMYLIEDEPRAVEKLRKFIDMTNIAEEASELDDDELKKIGVRVVEEYNIDKNSRKEWEENNEKWMKLAKLVTENKNFPWENASNIIYPILAQAAIQFAARAYQALIKDTAIVKGRVIGEDENGEKAARAERIAEHMSYQLTEEMDYWEDDFDHLLVYIAITGLAYKKTYRDKTENVNVSEFITADDLVINYWAPSMERVNRITQVFELYPNEVEEMERMGAYREIEYNDPDAPKDDNEQQNNSDEDKPRKFLEQHRLLDLDKDGYREPYIVTLHLGTQEVVRITARYDYESIISDKEDRIIKINPIHYFTKFPFMPSFDNSFYPIGYGALLGPGNEIIDSSMNQLFDAGTNANTGGGFIDASINIKGTRAGGEVTFKPGEWKVIAGNTDDLRKKIVPRPVHEPSPVIYNLLDLMIQSQEKLSSVANIMVGQQPVANVPATTSMATIEQALKLFTAIYKRLHRSLKAEFKKLRKLNKIYLSDKEYYTVLDEPRAIVRADYEDEDCDVIPSSNPNDITDTMRLLSAQALLELKDRGLNKAEVNKRYLEALHVPDIEKLLEQEEQEGVDPQLEIEMQKLEIEKTKLELEREKVKADIVKTKADAIKALADAEAKEAGTQLDAYRIQLEALAKETELESEALNANNTERMGRVENKSNNTGIPAKT